MNTALDSLALVAVALAVGLLAALVFTVSCLLYRMLRESEPRS